MTRQGFEKIFLQAVKELRKRAPKDTGNLAYNAIKYRWIDDRHFEIYVDTGDMGIDTRVSGVAPYMPFTNEPWISPRWNGKKNPNEGWWEEAVEYILNFVAEKIKGKVDK